MGERKVLVGKWGAVEDTIGVYTMAEVRNYIATKIAQDGFVDNLFIPDIRWPDQFDGTGLVMRRCFLHHLRANEPDLSGAELSESHLRNARLVSPKLAGLKARYNDWTGSVISGDPMSSPTVIGPADMRDSGMRQVLFQDVDLSGCHMTRSDMRGCRFKNVVFGDCKLGDMEDVLFENCNFTGTPLTGIRCRHAFFVNCTFNPLNMNWIEHSWVAEVFMNSPNTIGGKTVTDYERRSFAAFVKDNPQICEEWGSNATDAPQATWEWGIQAIKARYQPAVDTIRPEMKAAVEAA